MFEKTAMKADRTIQCPSCGVDDCHPSRWCSHEEKMAHPGKEPHRCHACNHRFMVRSSKRPERSRTASSNWPAVTVILIGVATVVLFKSMFQEDKTAPAVGNVAAATNQRYGLPKGTPTDPKDFATLVGQLQQSAESGDPGAMTHLGLMHKDGVGVLQDFGLAAAWIEKAANQGHADAMLELGRLYRDGVGFEADAILAYVWFNRAAAALNMDAVHEREDLASGMTPEQLRSAQELSAKT
jgi:DNA-directed RNA polymerase subunit RPC12/RpoP